MFSNLNPYSRTALNLVATMRSKGNFCTCEHCNNACDVLRDGRRNFTSAQRDIIMAYRRAHLAQQGKERDDLELRKRDAAKTDDTGQPLALLIFPDGMTTSRGDVPLIKSAAGNEQKSDKQGDHVENRVIGVEYVCGPYHGTVLFTSNNFIPGGANTMIAVVQETLRIVQDLLTEKGFVMPDTLYCQFDNWYVQSFEFFVCPQWSFKFTNTPHSLNFSAARTRTTPCSHTSRRWWS